MTFEEKAEIVINQLRADRDRLLDAIEKIKAEIDEQTEIHSDGEFYIKNIDVKRILAKYAEQEPCEDDYQTDMDEAWKQAKREPCDDAVSRQAMLDVMKAKTEKYFDIRRTMRDITDALSELPSVQTKPIDDDMTISVRPDSNGWYPNVCGMCANAESELCDWCGDNQNFRKIGMSEELVEHYKKLADHYNKRKAVSK